MKVNPDVDDVLEKGLLGEGISKDEAMRLMGINVNTNSLELYALMATANKLTRDLFDGKGEVHAQVGIDYAPCPRSCAFCAFGERHGIVKTPLELNIKEVVNRAKTFDRAGANAIFLMTTANYDFDRFLSVGKAVRKDISPDMPMVANIDDFGAEEAKALLDAGFTAVYHVRRLREGQDTKIDPGKRMATIKAARDVGMDLSYCVEPIGPEHTSEEIVEAMFLGKELQPTVMATMRRIAVPSAPLSSYGQISELELAKIEAITRLVMGDTVLAMGVHEPNVPSLLAGANQIYAETGPNPRDVSEDTSKGRGFTVERCREMLQEVGYTPRNGPARSLQGPLRK